LKKVGIIVEYNPLHNGHIYHINKIKESSGADIIIAVMSSSITMRGDLSIYNKFEKTKQALLASVDLVVELPFILAMQRADIFALNAIKILNLLHVNEIWIGSEENNIKIYEDAYIKYKSNHDLINDYIKKGLSYKEAYNNIYNLKSNDILGFSYYKAIKDNNFNIKLKTIKRINSEYLETSPKDNNITSALAIRSNLDLLNQYTPKYVYENKNILDENKIFNYLKYTILTKSKNELKEIFFVDEGLENKLGDIKDYNNLDEFINYLSTKRYTKSRIKRMLYYILFNIKKDDINKLSNIDFIRVLGFNEIGNNYLSKIKNDIKIYTNIKNGINNILDIELKVSKILDSIYNIDLFKNEQKAPVMIKK